MGSRQPDGMLHSLCQLAEAQVAQPTDGQLLRRFAADRDEAAFATLLGRHGRLVYQVCRNVLRHEHDAEDAFQATFMVLARRAGAIRQGQSLGGWLYRVAYRVAMKARKAAGRRRQQEERAARDPQERPASDLAWRELQAMLDEELNRLAQKYRTPFVLCCLAGKSKSEAAAELGWKEGTVSSRLAHARKVLQARLARRGVTLSAVLTGLAVAEVEVAAAVPAALVAATQKAAVAFGAREALAGATAPAAYARSVLWGMGLNRLTMPAAILVVIGLVGSATAITLHRRPTQDDPAPVVAATPAPTQVQAPGPKAEPENPPGGVMAVSGSVVGPGGNAVPGARVAVIASRALRPGEDRGTPRFNTELLGEGPVDEQGRFRLMVPQTTLINYRLTAVAFAPGYALSGCMAPPPTITAPEHDLPIQLARGHTVRCRLVDQEGRGAPRVRVQLLGMARPDPPGWVHVLYYDPPVPLPGWPDPIVSDDDGFFDLPGIGVQTQVTLQVRDERFATQWLGFRTGAKERAEPFVLPLASARALEGRVVADDTGEPLAGATVVLTTMPPLEPPPYGFLAGYVMGRTDREGRYRLRPFPGTQVDVTVYPPAGQPYLHVRKEVRWPGNAAHQQADQSLPRGVMLRGTVTELGTGRPVGGATVSYEWCGKDNAFKKTLMARVGTPKPAEDAATGPDGAFSIVVPPGPGTLLVKAAEPDFVHVEVGSSLLSTGTPGGAPYFPDAIATLRLQPGDPTQQLALTLRRGVTLRGRVTGHDGRPVPSALVLSPTYVPERLELKGHTLPVRGGRFELPGCEPGARVRLWFYDPNKKEGAVAELTADPTTEPEVRLAPCVAARLRLVNREGKPVAARLSAELVIRPGPTAVDTYRSELQVGVVARVVGIYGPENDPTRADEGHYLVRYLIPGATYAIRSDKQSGWREKLTFTAPLTGVHDAGDIPIDPTPKR